MRVGVGVQESPLGLAVQQRVMRMLAMNVGEITGDFTKLAEGGGCAVDVGARAAALVNDPAQQA